MTVEKTNYGRILETFVFRAYQDIILCFNAIIFVKFLKFQNSICERESLSGCARTFYDLLCVWWLSLLTHYTRTHKQYKSHPKIFFKNPFFIHEKFSETFSCSRMVSKNWRGKSKTRMAGDLHVENTKFDIIHQILNIPQKMTHFEELFRKKWEMILFKNQKFTKSRYSTGISDFKSTTAFKFRAKNRKNKTIVIGWFLLPYNWESLIG